MSEENNLSANSLCTTEDVFEQFQAGTGIYEEDGFITLSDIVSPQPEVPDLSNELNEIPYDNEVVLTSTFDGDTPLNVNNENNQHPNDENKQEIFDTCKKNKLVRDESYPNEKTHENLGRVKNQKRGRKKKSVHNNTSDSAHLETENSSFIDNQTVQDNVLSTTVNKNGTDSGNDLQEESKYPRRTRRERISNYKYPQISETSSDTFSSRDTPSRRRGRPKKSTHENLTISEPDSTNIDTPSLTKDDLRYNENSEPESSEQISSKRGRRGRPPKTLKTGLEQTNPNDTPISDDTDLPLSEIKKPQRGRKKMNESNEIPTNTTEEAKQQNEHVDVESLLADMFQLEENTSTVNESVQEQHTDQTLLKSDDLDNDDDGDDICLSKLKENIHNNIESLNEILKADSNMQKKCETQTINDLDPNLPIIADFEHHIDKMVIETSIDATNVGNTDESLLIEDTSKRPNRRKAKKNFKYEVDSDEDPFANVEISDDDEPKAKKRGKYGDDDEYVPGNKRGAAASSSDSELYEADDPESRKLKRKKNNLSPGKRGRKRKSDVEIEISPENSLSKTEDEPLSMKPPAEAWATSNEFENFIAQKIQNSSSLKIKKVSSKLKTENVVAPLDIPVINQNEPKKFIESAVQTSKTPTNTAGVQTSVPYDIPMKTNLKLSSEQSKKACAFLNSVVKTTSELGQLMKDKSEDFMKKKINTENVTDTLKMDYCVRKSFLLFKLAKHNLMQMEEDLAKQYDEFLRGNDLSSCREEIKNIAPTSKADSDSDCEIVDVKVPTTSTDKVKKDIKPNKTVFLNKELSIKIAKKPSAGTSDKNVDVKGRHTIWINDSVMVKKVKPTQSFLAQDSRNKKPPDYVTEKMVSDFFENYYHQRAIAVCAPFISTEWSGVYKEYACHYFVSCNNLDESALKDSDFSQNNNEIGQNMIEINSSTSNENCDPDPDEIILTHKNNPKSLISYCIEVVCKCLLIKKLREANEGITCDLADGKNSSRPLSLFRLCYKSLRNEFYFNMSNEPPFFDGKEEKCMLLTVPPLKSLCCKQIRQLMLLSEKLNDNSKENNENMYDPDTLSDDSSFSEEIYSDNNDYEDQMSQESYIFTSIAKRNHVKSLFSLCVKAIQIMFRESVCPIQSHSVSKIACVNSETTSPRPLKVIAYENINSFMFGNKLITSIIEDPIHTEEIFHGQDNPDDFTINCVNTMSEEAFHGLEVADEFQDEDDCDYEPDTQDFYDNNEEGENEWVSQVQMEVLRSCNTPVNNIAENVCDETAITNNCVTSAINSVESEFVDSNAENANHHQSISNSTFENINIFPQIKEEPQEEVAENIVDSSIIKTEPALGFNGMTIIPESIVTKSEMMEHEHHTSVEADEPVERVSTAFDVDTFEQFLQRNKMMHPMDDSDDEDLFGGRERREHEPDYDAENEMNESLLVPQTYETLPIDNAKGVLMESSSEESKDGSKKQGKKKIEKKRGRSKKGKDFAKNCNAKEIPSSAKEVPVKEVLAKEVPVKEKEKGSNNEVAMLTRRMRDKIRQEEKKAESSDSDSDNIALSLRKERDKTKDVEKVKPTKNVKQGESTSVKKNDNVEIQCNDVDSTDQSLENRPKSKDPDEFTGFSAIDQNEMSSYQKYMQFVFDKIVPNDCNMQENTNIDETNKDSNRASSPLINPDQPVELLECEPTMPIFDDDFSHKIQKRAKKVVEKKKEEKQEKAKPTFTERDGWHIYSIDVTDEKLYQNCHIPLEKLPETFVDTYLEYHDISVKDVTDREIDRLSNLQSLNRVISVKEGKTKSRQKVKSSEQNSDNVSRAASPAGSDHFAELTPSEDEGANVDDDLPPPVPVRATENNIAKNSLMDDRESDSDCGTKKIKKELIEDDQVEEQTRPGPKSKTKVKAKLDNLPPSQSLMLTADKMMNKELTLLHAPIVMKEEVKEVPPKEVLPKEPSPKEETKLKKRSIRILGMRDRLKTEDDSSSEEEKQWVSTKEKLLKRIGRKEDATADDAKRAKLVDDFIERRGEGKETRRFVAARSRKSRKKILEKWKQQRFLSKELLGEPSIDLTPGGKRGANVGLFKGRRNIRKVIDKKSLQKSTVLANMEEFERKRRLNAKLNQLRELLGCEEGVNVLVINDEVCLEYDFQEQRPIVTVHPFFTKVMKAHQYEGVKFMWDACFESLASIESGHAGGGCILAHCMGLGKTLQVLALLHTVLTHPRAGMHRVLVCCPLSTVLNWVDEIHKWIGPVTDQIKVFELSKLKKTYERAFQLDDWYSGGGIFIIGYELFRSLTTLDPEIDEVRPTIINKIRTALLDPGPDIIICDEGHLLKNDCSVLAVAMSRVVTKRRIVLTGTPMQNNLREYYCMVNFVKPNLLGTYSEYSNRFENPIMNGQHRDSREEDIKLMKARTHILHKVLEGCLQRQEASVLYPYLPKKHEYTVFIPLTKCQWDLYKHYVHHYTKKSKQSVLRDFHILQKIWSHPLVLHNFSTRDKAKDIKAEKLEDDLALEDKEDIKPPATETWWLQYLADGAMLNSIDTSNKFVAVFRILHECITLGDKVLIFSTSLDCLDALEYFLRQINGWNLGHDYYRLDGSVPAEVRQKWVREYNAENNYKTKLFLISTRAGCLGLNMTAANRVIILDTSWNPAHDIQSIFRVYRFGQKKDCYIYRLVAMGTMEQKIYERSVTKQAVACRVVDEQQIDRHYNMAELTELYRFDEHGVGVAGGVAVGVGDVVLLRVARDAAIHAVHEHDSLLRGSGEQGLPEHERAAAWMQFQQEHAHKQMQNDLETDKAARALKKLQEQQKMRLLIEQQQQLERQQAQVLSIKTEDGPVHNLLVPRTDQPAARGRGGLTRGRGRGRSKIVQCRIPISSAPPGPSRAQLDDEEDMVQQISEILVKHNYTETRKGPKQIKELVEKVRRMTQAGQESFEGCDELTASIAHVLLQKRNAAILQAQAPAPVMPALTDVEPEIRRRGRPKKTSNEINKQQETNPTPTPEADVDTGGRTRRRAALVAEMQFDASDDHASQDSVLPDPVIELDDDDWQAGHSDTDSAPETTPITKQKNTLPIDSTKKLKTYPIAKTKTIENKSIEKTIEPDESILLSDDEPSPPSPAKPIKLEKDKEPASDNCPLHPSLLSNQNFIKIVAHTYIAGNPTMDEEAATLAARYSSFKLLKESEETGKPIIGGPIYDIAVKVLGMSVLRKLQLQTADAKNKSGESNVSSKMAQFLEQESAPEPAPAPAPTPAPAPATAPTPAPVKKKAGPKSRVKPVIQEQTHKGPSIVPISLLRRAPVTADAPPTPAPPAQAAGECILPDDDDVCITEPAPKPVNFKVKLPPMKKVAPKPPEQKPPIRVTAGGPVQPPAAQSSQNSKAIPNQTICLDSDDDEPVAQPTKRTTRSATAQYSATSGPVPVALTGPNSQPIPLAVPPPAPPSPLPQAPQSKPFYPYPQAVRYPPAPVPVSLTGPDSRPVPISITGPDNRPMPISLTGPGFQAMPMMQGMQPTPVSYANNPAPMSFVGSDNISMPFPGMTQQVPMSFANAMTSSNAATSMPMAFTNAATSMPMAFTNAATSMPMAFSNSVTSVPISSSNAASSMSMMPSSAEDGVHPVAMSYSGARTMRFNLAPGQAASALQHMSNNVYLVPASVPGDRLLTCVPASQVPPIQMQHSPTQPLPQPTPGAPHSKKTLCKPGDLLRLTASGKLEIVRSGAIQPTPSPSSDVIHTIDDDEPSAPVQAPTPKTAKTAAPKMTTPKPPQPLQRPPTVPTPPTTTPNEDIDRRKRKISSSSSSSESSRSPSPPLSDPLAILKDVVHIQAPRKTKSSSTNASTYNKTITPTSSKTITPTSSKTITPTSDKTIAPTSSKTTSKAYTSTTTNSKTTSNQVKLTFPNVVDKGKIKSDPPAKHVTDILKAAKANKAEAAGKSSTDKLSTKSVVSKIKDTFDKISKKAAASRIKDSIDLTSASFSKCGENKTAAKGAKPTNAVKNPSTVVGTSKNIVLDGRSKSLTNKDMVDLTGKKSIQVTNVKTLPASSASKPKVPEKKRPAPPAETAAPKKKKTEPMTLKDFDIDDIDDIIELD